MHQNFLTIKGQKIKSTRSFIASYAETGAAM